jgi:hypothetical protein
MDLQPIVALPFFVSLYVLIRKSVEKAVLNVLIPVLLLMPLYDIWKVPSMPPLTFADTTIFPIGIWLIATRWRDWKFSRMDLWMLLFGVSAVWSLFHTEPTPTPGICYMFISLTVTIFPYAIGKLLIEQSGMREAVVRRIAFLLAVVSVLSLYEFRMGVDPFHVFWARFIPDKLAAFEQFRWGFCRVSGPYAQSETTGMVFIIGTLFAYWLYRNKLWEPKMRFLHHPLTKGTVILLAVCLGMYENQARGPYIGIIFGFLIARTIRGNRKRIGGYVKKTALILLLLGVLGFVGMKSYTSATMGQVSTDQGDAVYRVLLIQNYLPILEKGGLWGWGLHPPLVSGQASIDNAYLYFGVIQGYAGAVAFAMLMLEGLIAVFGSLRRLKERRDRDFAFCIGGCIAGLAICLGTVYLNVPVYQLLFLVLGWSQSLRPMKAATEVEAPVAEYAGHGFRRVFT